MKYKSLNIKFAFLFVLINAMCYSQAKKDTLNVLFVGNSYTYFENLTQIVSMLSDSTETKLITKKSTIGGSSLRQHWLGLRGLKSKKKIKEGKFDIVILQGHSMSAIREPDSIAKYATLFCDYIKANGSKPYLYQTWAREKVPQFQKTISKVYKEISIKNNTSIVPVGEAWKLSRTLRPDIDLFSPDGSHPSREGAFLTACVFVASLLEQVPENIPNRFYTKDLYGELIYLAGMDTLNVEFFKRIAQEFIRK